MERNVFGSIAGAKKGTLLMALGNQMSFALIVVVLAWLIRSGVMLDS